jgi:hypothetical protein
MTSGKLCLKPTLASIDDFSLKIGFFLKIRMNNPRDNRSCRSDFVGSSDRNDYYRFSVSQAINFNLTLSGLSANAGVQLLGSNGSVLNTSNQAGTAFVNRCRTPLSIRLKTTLLNTQENSLR